MPAILHQPFVRKSNMTNPAPPRSPSRHLPVAGILPAAILLGSLWCAAAESAVRPEEMKLKNDWVSQNVSGPAPEAAGPAGLFVIANHDGVDRNAARYGRPLIIGDKESKRGLFCHANSRILVRLPSPGKTFSATAGVDSNPETMPGRGSVVFSVLVNDQEALIRELGPNSRSDFAPSSISG